MLFSTIFLYLIGADLINVLARYGSMEEFLVNVIKLL